MGLPKDTPEDELVRQCLFQLQALLSQQTAPRDTAAILIEPVIGEGGYVPAPASFLKGLREVCDKHGILLICDEARYGRFYPGLGGLIIVELRSNLALVERARCSSPNTAVFARTSW